MTNIEKDNSDPMAEARKGKYFKQYFKEAEEQIEKDIKEYNMKELTKEERIEFDKIFPCVNSDCDENGIIAEQIGEDEWEPVQCEYCEKVRFPLLEFITKLKTETLQQERSRIFSLAEKLVEKDIKEYNMIKELNKFSNAEYVDIDGKKFTYGQIPFFVNKLRQALLRAEQEGIRKSNSGRKMYQLGRKDRGEEIMEWAKDNTNTTIKWAIDIDRLKTFIKDKQ